VRHDNRTEKGIDDNRDYECGKEIEMKLRKINTEHKEIFQF
jgi:hypothetical protein